MGIQNTAARPLGHHHRHLITPHGDSERATRRAGAAIITPHNPSWGFRTVDRRGQDGEGGQLITPHGDSELGTESQGQRRTAAHNPSWGFRTKQTEARQRIAAGS